MVDDKRQRKPQERRDSEGEPVRVKFDPRTVRSRKDNRRKVRHG